ncbi:tRNA lysidine(34) synthetase [Corynebacterium macginleyi]|uniref:tRNA lysidine(34) synthetase n=1 Tax=Corynebacterium macginleyi TaxID=38290 RepID=UPI000EF9A45E|nr:tRNA lysidine(34) synthetase [Corynebacterium macginleyi]MBK4144268.1 tRNA(Ile)-lysidine synthetase [Corynebacterium macginleyi]MBK4152337.1 tRNA(Ile)-lysidine synthetase [Corynebacterium macginleyi]MBK4163425.1 tRNA(Ile)-lysidine synthetase [Corynebacterium macginleyi]MBK4165542.1 tRNA(Ile)-lysidine synthetase [Corynebacterium macginleyi]RMB69259.1 tRNA(Ile)-lysidine synthetase [Corynebacterium macginleyi]
MSPQPVVAPFWPRVSPHFLACRRAVRAAQMDPTVAVGLSGGADSLALCAAMIAEGHDVIALCVDHSLQDGSREQAEKAARQAESLGAQARVLAVQVPKDRGKSMEAVARHERYVAMAMAVAAWEQRENAASRRAEMCERDTELGEAAREKSARGKRGKGGPLEIALAHTADDQAETLLLGALRGRVAGMPERAVVEGARVVRPFLQVRRANTVGACAELGLEVWHDPHNADTDFRRVALRREIIPELSRVIGGDAVPALAQAAVDTARDEEYLATAATADCAELAALPEPRRRRAIAAWLIEQGVKVTKEGIGGIGKLCTDWHGQGPVAVSSARQAGQRLEVARIGGKLALLSGH